jgi:hypothetical protein
MLRHLLFVALTSLRSGGGPGGASDAWKFAKTPFTLLLIRSGSGEAPALQQMR